MSRALRSLVIADLLGLSLFAWEIPAAKAGDGVSKGVQSSTAAPANTTPSAAPQIAKPVANANSGTSRSFSTDPGANWVYYYYPGYGGCYYYSAPAPAAAVGQPGTASTARAPSVVAPSVTAANANSGTYRSFSADPGANTTYSYANPGTYNYNYSYGSSSSSSGGHSWGSRR
ncbi:MAG TPA: hypothetical protein VMR25_13290 [Planctomycetaceae bacterium]|jgi:hypothetical protein|nr:hypothetical protein [Planctomycetaceae bacterium]